MVARAPPKPHEASQLAKRRCPPAVSTAFRMELDPRPPLSRELLIPITVPSSAQALTSRSVAEAARCLTTREW